MRISELEANSKVINLVATISSLEEIKEVPTGAKVQEGVLEDDTGQVKISFWDDQVGKFKEGDKVILSTGWCKEFPRDSGELQVSTGKFGKISLVPKEKPEN